MKSFIILFHFYLFATMVVAIPPLLLPCGFKSCTAELPPEGLAPHMERERFHPSYVSYLRSWIDAHGVGGSSSPDSRKRKADESRGNSPVGNLPVNNSPRNSPPGKKSLTWTPNLEIHTREWLLFLRRVVSRWRRATLSSWCWERWIPFFQKVMATWPKQQY